MTNLSIKKLSAWYRQSSFVDLFKLNRSHVFSNRRAKTASSKGCVYLIGAGPGEAELLTLKAYRVLQQADVIMYDWLVGQDVVNLFPSSAERIFVGKKCGRHSMQQGDIGQLMLEKALAGKYVVRVKGGDPAIFARLAEECDILNKHQVPCAVVPGITAASGASAYAGIPLTHRDCAQSVRFVTAHLKSAQSEPNWTSMVAAAQASQAETLVFYMGLKRLDLIMQRLTEHGVNPNMPVAVIDQATTAEQALCIGNVTNIAERVTLQAFSGPAICIVGEVVRYRHQVQTDLLTPINQSNLIHSFHA